MAQLRQSWWQLTLHAGLFILSVAIVFSGDAVLPFVDLPNHLARSYVIHNIGKVSALSEAYRVQWQFAPYVVMETTLSLLQNVMSVYAAGRVFISLCLASIVLGVIGINLALRPVLSVTTLLVYPIFFSQVLVFGFLNFMMGTGIALLSYAWWLRSDGQRHRLAILFVLFNVNFFVHPISYAILVIIVALHNLFDMRPGSQPLTRLVAATKIALLAVPQLPFWLFIPHDTLHNKVPFEFGNFLNRSMVVLSPFLFAQDQINTLIVLLLLFAIGLTCWRFKLVTIDASHHKLLLVLALLCLLVPKQMLGVSILQMRLPFVLALLMIGVAGESNLRPVLRRALTASVLSLALLQLVPAYLLLTGCSAQMEELRLALARYVTTPGTPLVSINDRPGGRCESLPLAYANASTLAVIESHSFAPFLFTIIPPVKAAARFRDIELGVGKPPTAQQFFNPAWRAADPTFAAWQERFNYLVWLHFGKKDRTLPAGLRTVAEGSYFTIFENPSFTLPPP